MGPSAKIAVSIDADLLRRLERLRARTGESRSAAIARALRLLTAEDERRRRVEDYVEAYRRVPEAPLELELARASARRSLAALPWEEE